MTDKFYACDVCDKLKLISMMQELKIGGQILWMWCLWQIKTYKYDARLVDKFYECDVCDKLKL